MAEKAASAGLRGVHAVPEVFNSTEQPTRNKPQPSAAILAQARNLRIHQTGIPLPESFADWAIDLINAGMPRQREARNRPCFMCFRRQTR
jgi:hypothetical protein